MATQSVRLLSLDFDGGILDSEELHGGDLIPTVAARLGSEDVVLVEVEDVASGRILHRFGQKSILEAVENRRLKGVLLFRSNAVYLLFPKWQEKEKAQLLAKSNGWEMEEAAWREGFPQYAAYKLSEETAAKLVAMEPEDSVRLPSGQLLRFSELFEREGDVYSPSAKGSGLDAILGMDTEDLMKILMVKMLSKKAE